MIKRLDPNQQADAAPAPKAADDQVLDNARDDASDQAAAAAAPQALSSVSVGAAGMSASTPVPTATSVTTNSNGSTTITMTPSTTYSPAPQLPMSSTGADLSAIGDINSDIVSRKMSLEEAKFQLDSDRAKHGMYMEIRKEDFREQQLREEEERNSQKEGEHWMKAYWRPAMGWLYMLICAFDFIIAPMLSMAMPVFLKNLGAAQVTYTQWQSLTLSNGGLIHLAFGAILGITAYTRGQEKIAKMG
jgi:CCR4-NOT transcriptional regulation complex NOT5 subunit